MTLENNLERIATSLEAIVTILGKTGATTAPAPAPVKEAVVPKKPDAPKKPVVPGPATPATVTEPASTPPTPALSREEVNAELVVQHKRLGGDQGALDKIMGVIKAEPFGVAGIDNLTAEQYGPLLDAVKALA